MKATKNLELTLKEIIEHGGALLYDKEHIDECAVVMDQFVDRIKGEIKSCIENEYTILIIFDYEAPDGSIKKKRWMFDTTYILMAEVY